MHEAVGGDVGDKEQGEEDVACREHVDDRWNRVVVVAWAGLRGSWLCLFICDRPDGALSRVPAE